MEKRDTCAILSTKLEEMQVSRKLDESSIGIIHDAIGEARSREVFWVSNKEVEAQTAFVIYHAARNTRIVLEKMHQRFKQATEIHENPKVIDDAMTVFPELSEMCSFIDSLQKVEIKPELLEFVRRRIRNLRNTAQRVQMLPSLEEEVKSVNKKDLAKELGSVAEDLRLNLV
jgi:hypothetical protein